MKVDALRFLPRNIEIQIFALALWYRLGSDS